MGMMINRRRVMGEKLPYDAEIEYLESTGTQFITTNFVPLVGDEIEIKFRNLQNNCAIIYAKTTDPNQFGIAYYNGTIYWKYFTSGSGSTTSGPSNVDFTVNILSNGKTYFNGTKVGNEEAKQKADSYYPLELFRRKELLNSYCRIYYVKFIRNGTLAFDFIPVRIGNVGYMYDKVSGTLFGNSGTGAFILGPDV